MEHCHLGLKKLRLIIINASKRANSIWAQCILSWINYYLMIVHFTFATGLPYSAIYIYIFLKLSRCVEPALSWHTMFPSGSNHLRMFFSPHQWVARNSRVWFCFSENGFSMFLRQVGKHMQRPCDQTPFVHRVMRETLFLERPTYFLGLELTNWWESFSICGTSNLFLFGDRCCAREKTGIFFPSGLIDQLQRIFSNPLCS